ncbi:chemotaxis protein CheW [Aestuariibius sp. HNIBRBA575]|uniref:chemotaxis protein CheW n=1 Tax=Aestuariibius sp. HNIBRBA575 TaxID=3233343 RepID=UPI0034A4AD60
MMLDHTDGTQPEDQSDTGYVKTVSQRIQTAQKRGASGEIYGSFLIGDSEFAIPVSAVQEVVNEPTDISPMPLAPPYMLGLFNLRGQIIPIVDLRILLGFSDQRQVALRRVAIIEYGEHCIGLLFDLTGEVLNGNQATRVNFQAKEDGPRDVVINGVLKFEQGNRLVQLLDPYELLNLDQVPRATKSSDQVEVKSAKGKRRNCISFQTGHTTCAIDLRYVKEILKMPKVDQSLFARGNVIGTTNLRGVILPVVDFRAFLGDGAVFHLGKTIPSERKMVVLETAEGMVGLMVFSIDSILPYYRDDVLPFAKLALPRGDYVNGCLISEQDKIVMMLDQKKLRTDPELVEIAKACQEIYPSDGQNCDGETTQVSTTRRTYILFTFEKMFALDTACVSEVINRPDHLLEPPYSLDFVEGIINLRGELITLFNPRLLYGMPPKRIDGQKVLIFRNEGNKYGILVDSVDEIIMTNVDNIAELQPLDHQGNGKRIVDDVEGCLHRKSTTKADVSVLVLDSAAVVKRCMIAMDQAQLR